LPQPFELRRGLPLVWFEYQRPVKRLLRQGRRCCPLSGDQSREKKTDSYRQWRPPCDDLRNLPPILDQPLKSVCVGTHTAAHSLSRHSRRSLNPTPFTGELVSLPLEWRYAPPRHHPADLVVHGRSMARYFRKGDAMRSKLT
jgi:hypothetical protein